jgi:quercetin dioxygenase-like cupin family protein
MPQQTPRDQDAARDGVAVIVDALRDLDLDSAHPSIYDRAIGLRLLFEDTESGAEHYLIRYPVGVRAKRHRHSVAHTIVVLDGRLEANGQTVGPGAYCHFPANEPMRHAPAEGESCLFVTIFHGPFDVVPLE